MSHLSSEQLAFIDACVRRAEDICTRLTNISQSNMPSWKIAEQSLALDREMVELLRQLEDVTGIKISPETMSPVDYAKAEQSIEYLRQLREPTEVETELNKLAARLMAKHQAIVPDALYRWRQDLERRTGEQ